MHKQIYNLQKQLAKSIEVINDLMQELEELKNTRVNDSSSSNFQSNEDSKSKLIRS